MEVAYRVNVSAKLDGKEKIVEREISKFINVCRDVQITATTTSKLALAFAIVIGLDMIARKPFAA